MALDNSIPVAAFCPKTDDKDTFIYTEMLNRGQKKGNNGQRLLKTFYHRSVEEFWEQWPTIKQLCDLSKVRACTRLAPKSFEKVGHTFLRMVTDAHITRNYPGMKTLYNRACGTTSANEKLWLFDVDVVQENTREFERRLDVAGHRIATIPSKKGLHYIVKPFDTRIIDAWMHELLITESEMSLHKDNPTNLYIPEGAD